MLLQVERGGSKVKSETRDRQDFDSVQSLLPASEKTRKMENEEENTSKSLDKYKRLKDIF